MDRAELHIRNVSIYRVFASPREGGIASIQLPPIPLLEAPISFLSIVSRLQLILAITYSIQVSAKILGKLLEY